jgi:hypothetical protein
MATPVRKKVTLKAPTRFKTPAQLMDELTSIQNACDELEHINSELRKQIDDRNALVDTQRTELQMYLSRVNTFNEILRKVERAANGAAIITLPVNPTSGSWVTNLTSATAYAGLASPPQSRSERQENEIRRLHEFNTQLERQLEAVRVVAQMAQEHKASCLTRKNWTE